MSTIMNNHRAVLLKFLIALLFVSAALALPTDNGLLKNTGVSMGCTEGCNNYNEVMEATSDSGYLSNASSALSVTTGMGFMAMFLWTLFSLW